MSNTPAILKAYTAWSAMESACDTSNASTDQYVASVISYGAIKKGKTLFYYG